MSEQRRLRRLKERVNQHHTIALANHLADFYEFLSQKVKPSDQQVRDEFLKHKDAWYKHCDKHKLKNEVKDLFVLNVEHTWKRKQSQQTTKQE